MITNTYNAQEKVVESAYKGFISLEEMQTGTSEIFGLATKHGAANIFMDTSEMTVLKKEVQDWLTSVWYAKAPSFGINKMAFLAPKSSLAKMSASKVNLQAGKAGTIEIDYFDNKSAALAWLRELVNK